jgi:hypothetical protein
MYKRIKALFLAGILIIFSGVALLAGAPAITSVIMSPPNPNFGDTVTITVTACVNKYTDAYIDISFNMNSSLTAPGTPGQIFVVSNDGINVPMLQPSGGANMGYLFAANDGAAVSNCTDCGSDVNSRTISQVYTVRVPPQSSFGSCGAGPLYLQAGLKDSLLGQSDWAGMNGCNSTSSMFSIPTLASFFSINQKYDGALQTTGDVVIFSVDYDYANGPLMITNDIPGGGNLTLVAAGPSSIYSGPVIGSSTSGTMAWVLPDRTGVPGDSGGTIWFQCKMTTQMTAGTTVMSTATGRQGASNQTSSAAAVVGTSPISASISQSESTGVSGDTVTYTIDYSVGGTRITAYRPFDDVAAGSYSASPPAGWKFQPFGGENGTWTISDQCGTGDRFITGDIPGNSKYPELLLDDAVPANAQFCTGIVMADALITPGGYSGPDATVVIRSNGMTGSGEYSYSLVLSVDNNPDYIAIMKITAGSAAWYNGGVSANTAGITGNTWFKTKTMVVQSGNDYVFSVKVWKRGDPEPGAWNITWTDTGAAADANFRCDGLGTFTDWRPGISLQRGPSGTTTDSYDNIIVYQPEISDNTVVYDTAPAGITYIGSMPAASFTGGVVKWNLGNTANQSGSLTWFGMAAGCGNITNNAVISGDAPMTATSSNMVSLSIAGCASFTPTNTPVPTMTFTDTPTPTNTKTPVSGTPTFTATLSITPTITPSITSSPVLATATFTLTPAVSLTSTPIDTQTPAGPTQTFTPTLTPTLTITQSESFTPTATLTSIIQPAGTATASPTITQTATMPVTLEIKDNVLDKPGKGCTISYYVEKKCHVQVKIYNRHASIIRVITDADQDPGKYTFTWYAKNDNSKDVVSGTYTVIVNAGGKKRTAKIAVIR